MHKTESWRVDYRVFHENGSLYSVLKVSGRRRHNPNFMLRKHQGGWGDGNGGWWGVIEKENTNFSFVENNVVDMSPDLSIKVETFPFPPFFQAQQKRKTCFPLRTNRFCPNKVICEQSDRPTVAGSGQFDTKHHLIWAYICYLAHSQNANTGYLNREAVSLGFRSL